MKIKYYGTAAAEGFPGMFCSCEVCEKARALGGRNIRTRSQTLIDGKLLIDFSADTYMHVINYGLDLRKVEAVLITHSHDDHLYPPDFLYRKPGYAYFPDLPDGKPTAVPIYSSHITGEAVRHLIADTELDECGAFRWEKLSPYKPAKVLDYTVTALEANHAKQLDPFIYIIQKGDSTLFYGHDSGYYSQRVWDYLETAKPYFNFVSLDCTGILQPYRDGHMGVEACSDVRERFLALGVADEKTVFCLHHFSHNGGLVHDDLVPLAHAQGFRVSYDTAEYEF
ncbi:MAG: hypothetical protein GX051_09740 [Clostridiales bacterium]|nr:hypothetical protein [Clostridiales bacterium]